MNPTTLAISTMDPTVQGIFYLAAIIVFLVAAYAVALTRVNLIALGLALFAIPFMWNAFAAS